MAKRHELKEILSNMATEKAVESIWIKEVILDEGNSQWFSKLNVPKTLFYMNVSTDLLFFMLLSLMMLTGMCVKARAQLIIKRTIFAIFGSNHEPCQATGLFIVLFVWFLSLISNEFRQLYLAWKNINVRQTYLTTTISGNIVDILSYLLFLIAFILHFASFHLHGNDYPQGSLVINPQLNENDFIIYCPFILPKYLVFAQAGFHILSILCDSS